jgi:hypothetical protein
MDQMNRELRLYVGSAMAYDKKKKELRDFSPQANYTDGATAACWRILLPTLADRGCRVVSATNPHGR